MANHGDTDDPIMGLTRLALFAGIIAALMAVRAARRRFGIIGRRSRGQEDEGLGRQ